MKSSFDRDLGKEYTAVFTGQTNAIVGTESA
jgi:hypothetical protein